MPKIQLDDENETLDWGNEEEEYQESMRKLHTGGNAEDGTFAGDDVEDTISLGDDEDDQRFYSLSRHEVTTSGPYNVDRPGSPPSSQSKSTASSANTAQLGHRSPEHQTHGAHVSVQERPTHQETPQKKSDSPQRSLPRLTHALPPKPVAASATALAQPCPVIAVTTITSISPHSAARDSNKMNGNSGKLGLSPVSADLPQDWETRCSRKGDTYYYNRVTHECTWTLPGNKPSIDPSQEDSKSRRVSPGGNKLVSIDSNTSRPQNSRSNKEFSRNGEQEIEERRRPLTPDANGLTFEDRHYRPGLNSVSLSDGIRDRPDIPTSAGRYARSPSPHRRKPGSSAGSELHFRTKELPHDQHSAQEKPAHSSSAPKLDSYRPEYDSRLPASSPPPRSPTDYTVRNQRERASYGTSEEDRMQVDLVDYTPGPPLRREDISRDHRQRSRDRDPPPARSLDVREPSASQNYFSAQRSRSPALHPPPRERNRDIWDGKHEAREHGYHIEAPSLSHHKASSVSAARSERSEKDDRHSDWERSRQHDRSHGPNSVQDYARGREWPIDGDVDPLSRRNLERERVRGERSERDRDAPNTRREVNARIDTDHPSMHPSESYLPRRFQGDAKSKRNTEDYDRKPEELASARSKRVPLPPQQATFRSAKLRDPPPHPISTPSKQPEDTRVAGVDDTLPRQPRQPRNSLSTFLSSSPDLSRPNGVDLERFRDGHERHERHNQLSFVRDSTSYLDKRDVTRDDASHLARRESGPPGRRLVDDLQRSSKIPRDSGRREQSPRPRASNNDDGRRDSNHEKLKDEKPIKKDGGSDRDVRAQLERSDSRRERDAPKQPARLTGTNNTPIGNRRSIFAGSTALDPEVGPSGTIPDLPRNLPPGKESYERPLDLALSDPPRQPGPPSRTESGKNRSLHELRQPQTKYDDEARGQKPLPRALAISGQYSNGSSYRHSTPPPLSRDISGSLLSSVPERLSTYPSSDSRSDVSFRASQHADPHPSSRGSYRQSTRWDQPRYSPKADEANDTHSHHLSAAGEPLPLSFRKSHPGGAGPDIDPRFSSSGDLRISGADRSDFISRVEPPPLRRGGSLLDRLSLDNKDRGDSPPVSSTSLRDRLVPSKRDRDEMISSEANSGRSGLGERPHDLEGSDSKRARKRGGKRRSTGRRI